MKTYSILVSLVLLLFINISFSQTLVNSFQKISATEGLFTGTLNDNDFFGRASTCIGDLDGDGVYDLAIGASADDDGGTNNGAVWILFLNSDGTVKSHQKISDTQGGLTVSLGAGGVFGSDVDTVGDLNGDGVVDLAIGAQYDSDGGNWHGAIWILFMNPDGTVNNQQKISDTQGGFTANFGATCAFGSGIDPIGDFNGDNVPDLIVGMRRDNDGGTRRGAVFIICLNQNGTVNSYHKISDTQGNFTGILNNEDFFGCSVASLGDLDGDTIVDIAVGAFGDDDGGSDHGCVWILFLNANGQVKSHQKISSTQGGFSGLLDNNDRFAHAMNPLGDFDDDGVNDLIVGTINDDDGGLNRGAAYLIYLNQNGTVKDLDKISNTQGGFNGILDDDDIFGQSVANIGDFNGGGTDDLIVGAALDDDGGLNKGAVYVLFMDSTFSSGNALDFDGINDYVDLGTSAGNGVRTIELWFRPENDINNSITDYAALVARNNDLSNEHEITLAFTPSMSDKGKLVFGIKNSMGNLYNVFSNSDSWNAGQWYHVAAVIHPSQGMMLFVDGIKQISTNSYSFATTNFSSTTSLGCWGDTLVRLFCGSIDDVRFSSEAIYTSDFTPPCPDLMADSTTIGMWNFNESGFIAVDSSSNSYDGQLVGATRIYSDVCDSIVASGNVLYFDGVDDYVDLGSDVGNGIRTLELWFKPTNQINNSITDYAGLVVRNNGVTTNENEFNLTFTPSPGNNGKLIFGIEDDFGNNYHIYSDSNSWNAGQWYHVAAVVHPIMGMMMFIDGVKQSDTNSYNSPTGTLNTPTSVGRWGNQALRHYHGRIDDVRFSSDAIYTTDFTPPCPDVNLEPTTVGLWHFNEGSGTTAYDESSNGYNGIIDGAIYLIDTVCDDLSPQTISGMITYDNSVSTPLPNVKVYLLISANQIIDSTISSITGEYAFLNVPPGTYIINSSSSELWGGGNAADALAIMMHFVSIQPLYGLRLRAADCDISTYVNTMDALYVSQRFVYLIYSFPAGDWVFEQPAIIILGIAPVIQDYKGLCVGDVNGSFVP